MTHTRVEQWRDESGHILMEYAAGTKKPIRVPMLYLDLKDVKPFLEALDAAMDVARSDDGATV